jgi:hypothetical protein
MHATKRRVFDAMEELVVRFDTLVSPKSVARATGLSAGDVLGEMKELAMLGYLTEHSAGFRVTGKQYDEQRYLSFCRQGET